MLSEIFAKSKARAAEPDRVQQWCDGYVDVLGSFPEGVDAAFSKKRYLTFQLTGVFSEGLITGRCVDGGDAYNVFANLPRNKPAYGCNCAQAAGGSPCLHSYGFLDYVTDLLFSRRSSICEKIRQQHFDLRRPDMEQFKYDPRLQVRQILESLIPKGAAQATRGANDDESDDEAAALPPLDEAPQGRIAWSIDINNNRLELTPILQTAKKRGNGWTKGRRVALDHLREHARLLTPADRQVADLIQFDTTYYRPRFHLDSVDGLKCLVEQPNVFCDGEPVQVQVTSPVVAVEKNRDGLRLKLKDSSLGSSSFVFAHDCMVHVCLSRALVQLNYLSRTQLETLRNIVKMPFIPLSEEAEVLTTAQRLQAILPVELPEALAGKVTEEDYSPVMLLRSRSDGALDYGLRLRDSSNRMLIPGVGPMLRTTERAGERLQLLRSASRELRLANELADRYRLEAGQTHGTLVDFEVALKLIEDLHVAEADGEVEILWDKSSQQPLRMLGSITPQNVSVGISRKRDWFQLSGTCDLGEQSIELSDLLNGLQNAGVDAIRGDFIRLGDKGWAKISRKFRSQLKNLHDSVNQERGTLKFDMTSAHAIRDLLAEEVEMKASAAWNQCLTRLDKAEKLEPQLPEELNAELRDYQHDGFKWLRRLAEWGVGGVLADDMGLGKTLQTLAVILDRAASGPTLVIAPTSVGFNWVRETERFAPTLDVHLYRETERAEFLQQVGPNSLVVCSYGLALRDAEALAKIEWSSLILDEAQAIKNSRSKTSTAIATIPAQWKLALTGTPVENHLGELWSLLHVISPGVLGGWEQFRRRFAAPIEKDNDEERRMALRERLKPFLLRRTKEEVLKDLPPRSEMNLLIELSPEERKIYDKVRLSALGEIDELAKLSDVKDQRFRILALLTRMRQLSCSPRLVHADWQGRSTKTQQLCDTLLELREEGHRVLVFSQFVQHLSLIREMLDEEKISYVYLDGSTEAKLRQERVDTFQNGDATVFLISLKAGGTGLNLTAADYVIHMDPWWNPAVEDQATDRAHRIGQDKPVMVYRLVSQGTIEEEILKLHDSKRDLVAGIMEGAQAAAKLSTSDLIAMLRS